MNVVARRDIAHQNRDAIALGMFQTRENIRESLQCLPFWHGSCFSEEDLSSSLIGFYLAVHELGNPRLDSDTWHELSRVCNFPSNRVDAINWSLSVFRAYGDFSQLWTEWGNPRLLCNDPIDEYCGTRRRSWPQEFQTIIPEAPSRSGNWWLYERNLDGYYVPSNLPNVGFLYQGWWR